MTKLVMIGNVEVYTDIPRLEVIQYLRNAKMNCIKGSKTSGGTDEIYINLANVLYVV